jgi:hypothetical protein
LIRLEQGHGSTSISGGWWTSLFGPHGHIGIPSGGAPQIGASPGSQSPSWFTRDLSNPVRSFFGMSRISTAPTSFTPPTRGMLAATRASQVPLFAPAYQYTPPAAALNAIRADEAAVKALTAAYIGLRDAQLNEANLQLTFKAGLFGLTAAIKGNGHSLSLNTAAGVANRQALVQLLTQAEAGAKASKDYGRQLLANVQDFRKHAEAAGFSKAAVDALLRSMHMLPAQIKSTVSVLTGAAKINLDMIQKQIAELPTYKTITVGVQTVGNLSAVYQSQVPRHHAVGGMIGRNEFGYLNEAGPESYLSDSMGRVRIFSHAQSSARRSVGTSARRQTVRLVVDGQEFRAYLDSVVSDGIDRYDAGF